jgi:pyruvate ferredoxin oxidoreductase delta subunit
VTATKSGSDMTERSVRDIAMSAPCIGEAGLTGDWRNKRPVVDPTACLAVKAGKVTCQICWVHCPEACIEQGAPPVVDLDYCKGCGICAEECPADAIAMVPESMPGSCEMDAAKEAGR